MLFLFHLSLPTSSKLDRARLAVHLLEEQRRLGPRPRMRQPQTYNLNPLF